MKILNQNPNSKIYQQSVTHFGHKKQFAKNFSEKSWELFSAAIAASGMYSIILANKKEKHSLDDIKPCKEIQVAMSRFSTEELNEFLKSGYLANIELLSTLNDIKSNGIVVPRFNAKELLEFAKYKNVHDLMDLANVVTPHPSGKFITRYLTSDLREFINRNADLKLIAEYGSATITTPENKLQPKYFLTPKHLISKAQQYISNITELEEGLENIDDIRLYKILKEQYLQIQKLPIDQREKQIEFFSEIINAYNNLTNKYLTLASSTDFLYTPNWKIFINYCKCNNIELNELGENKHLYYDLIEQQRTEVFINLCQKARQENLENDDVLDYMYENIYLNTLPYKTPLPPEVKNLLININREFNTKIFVPTLGIHQDKNRFIKKELIEWHRASSGTFTTPPTIDLLKAKNKYLDETSAYGKSKSAGSCKTHSKAIELDGYQAVEWTLRHELMHANDTKLLKNFPDDWYDAKSKTVKETIKNNLFTEFKRANPKISKSHFEYAFNNPKEFIAVAAEGNMKKYSQEFINLLIEFGMPEWAVNLRPI